MSPEDFERNTFSTVTKRLMPLLFVCYTVSYIDRVNVGFAKLQMASDLHMSNAVYGMGAGIFFIGYFLFEVPGNLLLQRLGARIWLGSIMIVWGVISAGTMLVHSAKEFYLARFLLGTVEAGFFPGVILYLTFWYTERYRARIVATFMSAIPLSGVLSGAVSGWILSRMAGIEGLRGWQWLFLLEGLPPVLLGVVAIKYLPDEPMKAPWLDKGQKELLTRLIKEEHANKSGTSFQAHRLLHTFKSPIVWGLCAVFFWLVVASYGIGFWLPQLLSDGTGRDPLLVGLLSMIPWGAGAVAMILVGRHSDLTGERRWHLAISALVAAAAFAISAVPHLSQSLGLVALSIATAGVMASIATFWALPSGLLPSGAAAAGIAWINSVGSLAGYISPYAIGRVRDATDAMMWPLLLLAISCLFASGILLRLNVSTTATRSELLRGVPR